MTRCYRIRPAPNPVVDDEEDIRNVLVNTFRTRTWNAPAPPSLRRPQQAQEAQVCTGDHRRVDAGMSGTELLRHIKKHDPDTEVIVVSA